MGRRYRCRFGTRCMGIRLSRLSRPKAGTWFGTAHGIYGRRIRRWRVIYLPFSRRQCLDRPTARAQAYSGQCAWGTLSAEDVVTARVDYSRLDHPASPMRIRLSSTVARARNIGDHSSSTEVEIAYVRGGVVYSVRARACVLACYNRMISTPLSGIAGKAKGKRFNIWSKLPLVYSSVALTNWMSFKALGISRVYSPGSYHSSLFINPVIDMGEYRSPRSPTEPVLVQMARTPAQPGLPERDQHRAGQFDILNTSFETFERNIRDELACISGRAGLIRPEILRRSQSTAGRMDMLTSTIRFSTRTGRKGRSRTVIGRAPFGRITIANSDFGAAAYRIRQ